MTAVGYEPQSVVDTPIYDTRIWRYMDLPKFVSLLEKDAVFFSRADKRGDPYEGSLTTPTLAAYRNVPPEIRSNLLPAMVQWPSHILTSCWYAAETESPDHLVTGPPRLSSYFGCITRRWHPEELRATDAQAVIAYLRLLPGPRPRSGQADAVRAQVDQPTGRHGHWQVELGAGLIRGRCRSPVRVAD